MDDIFMNFNVIAVGLSFVVVVLELILLLLTCYMSFIPGFICAHCLYLAAQSLSLYPPSLALFDTSSGQNSLRLFGRYLE